MKIFGPLFTVVVAFPMVVTTSCSDSSPAGSAGSGGTGGSGATGGTAGSGGSGGADSGAPSSTIPSELRDVEQVGEDLTGATFGTLPDRAADWPRATTLLASMKTRWAKAKANVPGLPTAAVQQIEAAILALDSAVPAQRQKESVTQASQVVGAVPDLFELFHPAVPKQVIHMDAVGVQVALEAHFADWSATMAARSSLGADWTAVKTAAHDRMGTCKRVAGVETVELDYDTTLTAIDDAMAAKDTKTTEEGAEKILGLVDTLELLFNCPKGNDPPAHGLGSRCTQTSDCDANQVCDTANNGGRCAPDPAKTAIGTPCTSTADCGTDRRSVCATQAGDSYPGGYCIMEPCDDIQICPPGATCVAQSSETPACFNACKSDSDCRTAEGYVCQLFLMTPPDGYGPSESACSLPCARDTDCKAPLTCEVASGKCKK